MRRSTSTNPQGKLLIHYTTTVIGSCVGLTSGTKYLPRGSTTSTRTYAADRTPYQVTIENQFVIISQGNRPNERFSYRGHATVNSNGDLAVNYDRIKLVCE